MARLRDAGVSVRLRLVGDGPDRPSLESADAQSSGWRSRPSSRARSIWTASGALSEADIFALASFAEGIPIVLMEAMAMEIPCVTTRITGIPELIRDDHRRHPGRPVGRRGIGRGHRGGWPMIRSCGGRWARPGENGCIDKYHLGQTPSGWPPSSADGWPRRLARVRAIGGPTDAVSAIAILLVAATLPGTIELLALTIASLFHRNPPRRHRPSISCGWRS
jgi:hypothetical protein